MRNFDELKGVNALGRKVEVKYTYDPDLLESFVNKHPSNDYLVTLDAFEFTSLCPITGQPDYARLTINYIPGELMVESKSLKLYLASFRNSGEFHEDCINIIMKDLVRLMSPKYIEVFGLFNSRGGIAICPFASHASEGYQDMARDRIRENMQAQIAKNNG